MILEKGKLSLFMNNRTSNSYKVGLGPIMIMIYIKFRTSTREMELEKFPHATRSLDIRRISIFNDSERIKNTTSSTNWLVPSEIRLQFHKFPRGLKYSRTCPKSQVRINVSISHSFRKRRKQVRGKSSRPKQFSFLP